MVAQQRSKLTENGKRDAPGEIHKGQNHSHCIGQKEIDQMKGKRVLIVDDVISTGGSLKSIELLVDKAGGNVVGKMAVLAEGDAADRDDIIFLEKLPLFNEDGSVK